MKTKIIAILILIWMLTGCELLFGILLNSSGGGSAYKNTTLVTGFDCTVNENNLTFSWDKVPGASCYRLYFYTSDKSSVAQLYESSSVLDGFLTNNSISLSIRPGTYYYWWVTCIINGYEGPKGDYLYKGAKIGQPTGLTCLEKTDSSAFLWWNAQTTEDGIETEYQLSYKKPSSFSSTTLNCSTHYVEIMDLEKKSEYEIYVKAKKENGSWSDKSEKFYMTTSPSETQFKVVQVEPNETSVSFSGLNNNDIYLININSTDNIVASKNLRWITSDTVNAFVSQEISEIMYSRNLNALSSEDVENNRALADAILMADDLTAKGKSVSGVYSNGLVRLEAELPNFENLDVSFADSSVSRAINDVTNYTCTLGSIRYFYMVENDNLYLKESLLCAIGDYCYIWVDKDCYNDNSIASNDNFISSEQAERVQATFDMLYPYVTSVFGDKYQGSEDEDFIEKKDKISIFINDISQDYEQDQISGVLGYFNNIDFLQEYIIEGSGKKYNISNQDELFYIDTHFVDSYEKMAMSTLAHEFQHMLRYVNKGMRNDSNEVWCNEMGSLLCEELIQHKLEISDYDSPKSRLYQFCRDYYQDGMLEWDGDSVDYATVYAFGAWLVRNYGGVDLLNKTVTTVDDSGTPLFGKDLIEAITGKKMEELLKEFVVSLSYQSMSEETAEENGWKILNKSIESSFDGQDYVFDAINLKLFNYYNNDGDAVFGVDYLPGDGNLVNYVSGGLEQGSFTVQYFGKVGESSSETTTLELNTVRSTSTGLSTYIIIQ